jgi:oligopeptide/dipeptide ABC transporter, ATP-binding protein, C-terminal domain
MADHVLEVRDLRTYFFTDEGRALPAVDGVTFSIPRGKTLALVGESGCGKSVTSASILRLIQSPGRIVDGRMILRSARGSSLDLAQLDDDDEQLYRVRGGLVSMIFQEPMTALSPVHTVGNQIIEAIRLHQPVDAVTARKTAIEMLRKVGIGNPEQRIDQYPHEMSGGMRQRVVIAMALVCRPELLIADEPTTALDVTIQAQILTLIKDLQQEIGCSVLLITHDLGVVAQSADEVAVMYLGRIVEHGPVAEVLRYPKHPYTRGLLRSLPSFNHGAGRLASIPGTVPSLNAIPPGCPFHPRCEFAQAGRCDVGEPPKTDEISAGHSVACVRAREIDAQAAGSRAVVTAAESARAVTTAGEPLLTVRGLSKFFPIYSKGLVRRQIGVVRAVDDVSFTLQPGETLGLVGESGSGKTTVSRAILRALMPTQGEVWFRSRRGSVDLAALDERALKPLRREMQMIFQDPYASLNPRMTVAQIVGEPLVIHGLARGRELDDRVGEILRKVGLKPEHRGRFPHAFSGGQRQRIGIARALILQPALVVADEAVSALDVSVQAQVLNLLKDLQGEFGLTYLFVAHNLDVVRHVCDRVAVMYAGRLVEVGPTAEVFADPQHPYTQALISAVPDPDPARRLRPSAPGEIADPSRLPAGCAFHPRCGACFAPCKERRPGLVKVGRDHFAACHAVTSPGEVQARG